MQRQTQALSSRNPSTAPRGHSHRIVRVQALFGRSSAAVAEKPTKTVSKTTSSKTTSSKTTKQQPIKESFISQTLNAFDFAEVRSQKDRELLYEAKYGERGPDGKMTREQYQALRRKIGGTARDYWKDYIEADVFENTYTKAGGPEVPYLPFLVGVVVAMLGATAYVISQTA